MPKKYKLKRCPFCGGTARDPLYMGVMQTPWGINCENFCAAMFDESKEKVVEKWNTRKGCKCEEEKKENKIIQA